MGPKYTGELWVYIGTPLPNPSGNTGVMVCYVWGIVDAINIQWKYGAPDQTMAHLLQSLNCLYTCSLENIKNAIYAAVNEATYRTKEL